MKFFILVPLLASAVIPVSATPAQLALRDNVAVSGARIRLADVAELASSSTGSAFALPETDLGAAPLPGYSVRLGRQDIAQLLRARGLFSDVTWQGALSVRVERLLAPFDTTQLVSLAEKHLRTTLGKDITRAEVQLAQRLADLQMPAGQIDLRARVLTPEQALRRTVTVWIDIFIEGARLRTVPVIFQLRAYRNVMTAAHPMSKDVMPTCEVMLVNEADVADLDSPAAAVDCTAIRGRLKRPLRQGAVLLASDLQRMHAVTQGDTIQVIMKHGAIVLESRAVAMADGEIGQRIDVKPSQSAAPIHVEVIAPGTVSLAGNP